MRRAKARDFASVNSKIRVRTSRKRWHEVAVFRHECRAWMGAHQVRIYEEISMTQLSVRYLPVETLLPYAGNARTHSGDQVGQIAASIAEFGFVNPILVGEGNVIIAGHGRLMAAQKLGLATVPVIELPHLSESQRRALVIADNRIAENAGWDEGLLRQELVALQEIDFDLDLLGFSEQELEDLLA